jgi:hypothetical protein
MTRFCVENTEGGPESRTLITASSPRTAIAHYARTRMPALGMLDRISRDPEGPPTDYLVTGTTGRTYSLRVTERKENA